MTDAAYGPPEASEDGLPIGECQQAESIFFFFNEYNILANLLFLLP
jgi:hypothetical protein